MLTIDQLLIKPPSQAAVACPHLARRETGDLAAVSELFGSVPCRALGQPWLAREENDFAPASVRIGWHENSLLVFAELIDLDICNFATKNDQRVWELGDAFEIFLQPAGHSAYVELQITPDNRRLQLRFTDDRALDQLRRTGSVESVLMSGEVGRSRTWVQPAVRRWYVYAEIKAQDIGDEAGPLQGREWRFSFSRYDYTTGRRQPVISSTSRHAEPDFHRRQEWDTLVFEPSMAT